MLHAALTISPSAATAGPNIPLAWLPHPALSHIYWIKPSPSLSIASHPLSPLHGYIPSVDSGLGLPFGVGRHLDPVVVQAGDQAHDRVADPQGPGSFPDEGSGSTKGVLPLLRVSRHSRAEDMAGLFEVAPLLKS